MSSEHGDRTYPVARRETMGAFNAVVGEVFDPRIKLGNIELASGTQIERMNVIQFGQEYSIVGVASNIGISDNAFSAGADAASTFRNGSLKLTLSHEVGDDLIRLRSSDPNNGLALSRAANRTFIHAAIELLGHLADRNGVVDEYDAVMKDRVLDGIKEGLGQSNFINPQQLEQLNEYMEQVRGDLRLKTHGMALDLVIGKKPFANVLQNRDFQMRRFLAGNLFPLFAQHMSNSSSWYVPPNNPNAYIPPAKENINLQYLNAFMARNGYLSRPIEEVLGEYGIGAMGRREQEEVAATKRYESVKANEEKDLRDLEESTAQVLVTPESLQEEPEIAESNVSGLNVSKERLVGGGLKGQRTVSIQQESDQSTIERFAEEPSEVPPPIDEDDLYDEVGVEDFLTLRPGIVRHVQKEIRNTRQTRKLRKGRRSAHEDS